MPLAPMKELIVQAQNEGRAVGAFEVWNLESIQAVVSAAESLHHPVILQIGPIEIQYATIEALGRLAVEAARRASVPVAVHLDHGESFEMAVSAIRNGFTSVMIDASAEPYEDNVRLTGEVANVAHAVGVTVEGELGVLGVLEGGERSADEVFTDPALAADYVARTRVDALAVAIGNAHGFYKGEPKLDLERLAAIRDTVDAPLVLHGGTGVPPETLRRAIRQGIAKVNICTEFVHAFIAGYADTFAQSNGGLNVGRAFTPARERAQALVENNIRLFAGL